MSTRCLIIDDEPLAVRLISSYVQQVPELEIAAICNNAIDALGILRDQKIDLLFLDIKMPKLMGTDFLRSIPNPPKVIFVTAYREYALEGYELDIVDYLLKPVSFARFLKAVQKAMKVIGVDNGATIENGFENDNKDAFLYFKIDKQMQKVILHDILFVESCKEYVKLHFDNGKTLLVKQGLTSLQKLLSPHRFLRVHRSYIVTIEKIISYTPNFITIGNQKIPIGRLYKNEVSEVLKH